MKTRTVLLIGGPRDGHRVQVEEFAKFIVAVVPVLDPLGPDARPRPTNYPAAHYQIHKLRGAAFEGYIATLGTDPRDPMQILFEEYGKAGA